MTSKKKILITYANMTWSGIITRAVHHIKFIQVPGATTKPIEHEIYIGTK